MWRAVDRLRELPVDDPLFEQHRAGHSPWLVSAKIKLVDACNLRCFMCDYWQLRRQHELSTDEVVAVLADLATLQCQKVHFTGGEMFLRRDALILVETAHRLGMRVNLTTNGTLLTKEIIKSLMRLPVRSATLSLDGPERGVHDAIRGRKGAFKQTTRSLATLFRLRSKKSRLRLNTVVSRKNFMALRAMPALLGEFPVDGWLLIPMDPKGTGNHRMRKRDIDQYNAEVAPGLAAEVVVPGFDPWIYGRGKADRNAAAAGRYARGYYEANLCHVPWFHTLVNATGEVYPCCMGHRELAPLGNVRDQPLVKIFNDAPYRRFRREMLVARKPVCHGCDDFLGDNRACSALLASRAAGLPAG